MKRLQHKNIVTLHEVIDDPVKDCFYMVQEVGSVGWGGGGGMWGVCVGLVRAQGTLLCSAPSFPSPTPEKYTRKSLVMQSPCAGNVTDCSTWT